MASARAFAGLEFPPVLIATPNVQLRKKAGEAVSSLRWQVEEAVGGADALDRLGRSECQIVVLGYDLPDLHHEEVVRHIRRDYPGVSIFLLDQQQGLHSLSEGHSTASEMFCAAFKSSETKCTHPRLLRWATPPADEPLPGMIGSSPKMRDLYRMARLVARKQSTVLLLGESGTGKDVVANAIHQLSPRAESNLVALNCAAIPETLLEAELFGFCKGAFTGAFQSRAGKIQSAHGGTLFLDEIGDFPLDMQAKLLRFLETGEIQKLGTSEKFKADVRIIAATNTDLFARVQSNRFRADLYYRLAVFPLSLPSLKERGSDVIELATSFLQAFCGPHCRFSQGAIERLRIHRWPGNVRELKHVIERAAILAEDSEEIEEAHILIPEASQLDQVSN